MFIVVEGLDGAGKSTQVSVLTSWLQSQGMDVEYLHFPRFSAPLYGELIAKFLRGELGDINSVSPELIALIYAGDRADASALIKGWQRDSKVVLVDRYVLSNIAYQCAKVRDANYSELKSWILSMEYEHFKIARPDVTIFLDVPFKFTEEKLSSQREGEDREYLHGKDDIHEASLSFQERVREVYLAHSQEHYHIVECADNITGEMLSIEDIAQKIQTIVKKYICRK